MWRIPQINKKIFVARKGFQKDAVNVAKEKGIELFTLETHNPEDVINWIELSSFDAVNYDIQITRFEISHNGGPNLPNSVFEILHFDATPRFIDIESYIRYLVTYYLGNILITQVDQNNKVEIPLNLSTNGIYALDNGKRIDIDGMKIMAVIIFKDKHKNTSRDIYYKYGEEKLLDLKAYTYWTGDKKSTSLISKSGKNEIEWYSTDNQGNTIKIADMKIEKISRDELN